MDSSKSRWKKNEELIVDNVSTSQTELGFTVPDGGYGWIVFLATLFFQALIPSLSISFGMFLVFSILPDLTTSDINPRLWDDKLTYTPLLFVTSWTFFDALFRKLISFSTWPRLVATAGTCLTCAGLLFMWIGMSGYGGTSSYAVAGILTGTGASIQIAQCEIILAQYFRLKHSILTYITQGVTALGFVITPIVIGHHILSTNMLNVTLWYQAIILQGLVCNLTFKKPAYLKTKHNHQHNYVTANMDDEEDIFSKNSRELQIKRQDSTGTTVTIEKHEIPTTSQNQNGINKTWVIFDDDDKNENTDEENKNKNHWVKFDETNDNNNAKPMNLKLELAFAEEEAKRNPQMNNFAGVPMPLFTDLPVNNNNTYSYDILDQSRSTSEPVVFLPITQNKAKFSLGLDLLRQPTFYKSLLTVMTTKYSFFIYYTFFPTYLYQELEGLRMKGVAALMGVLALSNVLFSFMTYWVNIEKKRRPICIWFFCWMGALGYFLVVNSDAKHVFTLGAVQISLSIATLQYVGLPLLGLTLRGEPNKEYNLISILTGCSFLIFLFINPSIKKCFRLVALLHFVTGTIWFCNYIYKKLII